MLLTVHMSGHACLAPEGSVSASKFSLFNILLDALIVLNIYHDRILHFIKISEMKGCFCFLINKNGYTIGQINQSGGAGGDQKLKIKKMF